MGLDSEMLEGQKRNKVGLSYLPVLYGALPLSDFVDVLQPPLPLVDEPSHVLHGIQGSLHILEIPGEDRGVRWAEWLLSLHSGGVAWHRAGDGTRSSTCRLAQLFCAAITHLLLLLGQLLRHSLLLGHSYGLVTNLSHLWGRGEVIKFSYRGANRNCWKNLRVLIFFLQHYTTYSQCCCSHAGAGLWCRGEAVQQ